MIILKVVSRSRGGGWGEQNGGETTETFRVDPGQPQTVACTIGGHLVRIELTLDDGTIAGSPAKIEPNLLCPVCQDHERVFRLVKVVPREGGGFECVFACAAERSCVGKAKTFRPERPA